MSKTAAGQHPASLRSGGSFGGTRFKRAAESVDASTPSRSPTRRWWSPLSWFSTDHGPPADDDQDDPYEEEELFR